MPSDHQEQVVLCDIKGKPIGLKEKLAAHFDGDLHLAFSVMIFRHTDEGVEFLLQQRALHKYHSGGLWSNTVCSHPRNYELISVAALRRMGEELGLFTPLRFKSIGHIIYKAQLENGLIEHEYDHILLCECPVIRLSPNPDEVMACRWWTEAEIEAALDYSEIQADNQSEHQAQSQPLSNSKFKSEPRFTAWFSAVFSKTREALTELAI
ncbi:isopentenyl-diphosphate Delta-isomerase [Thalassotalea litorea]|uniref:Isopentenyl-diphosphate Delta-isomerase n=1 Tax=Thalassotalea litorea TaxID=2020715 RepID=A0A5R9IRW1_9GAMM|nr:isopentenyl-diphosphate Delta-isomerase [Thalassotalea litorea]TLU67359.1 isopentenyl-diphosphate Delta-isomerase [Thalassotalea litorea]